MWCSQRKELGAYHKDSRIMFLDPPGKAEALFSMSDNLRKHPKVASIEPLMKNESSKYGFRSYNFFHGYDGMGEILLNGVWTETRPEIAVS